MALEIFTWVKHIPGNRRLLIKPVKAQRLIPVTAYPGLSYAWHDVSSAQYLRTERAAKRPCPNCLGFRKMAGTMRETEAAQRWDSTQGHS